MLFRCGYSVLPYKLGLRGAINSIKKVIKNSFVVTLLSASLIMPLSCQPTDHNDYYHNGGDLDYYFDFTISKNVLEKYLSRAITLSNMLQWGNNEEDLRLIENIGAKFIGRAVGLWGEESKINELQPKAREIADEVHAVDPDIILQAGIFEIITPDVNNVSIPDWVFDEFGLEPENRNFNYEDIHYPNWGSVPDMSRLEARMWFFYLGATYIDLGVEAIHFGQVERMDINDPGHVHWCDLLSRVRDYANKNARRQLVLCDAHVPGGGIVHDGQLMFDLHSFPLRIKEVQDRPLECVLEIGHLDSIYGRSAGGITPSGWWCENLPYLVEFDNWGASGREGEYSTDYWVWGYDEIGWLAHQSETYRNQWIRYSWNWVRENDPNGHVQMPFGRPLHVPVFEGIDWFYGHTQSDDMPYGLSIEATVKEIWFE